MTADSDNLLIAQGADVTLGAWVEQTICSPTLVASGSFFQFETNVFKVHNRHAYLGFIYADTASDTAI